MRGFVCAIILISLGRLSCGLARDQDSFVSREFVNQFRQPSPTFAAKQRWWWPGSDVEENELRHELGEMARGDFSGAEISFLPPTTEFDLNKFGWASDSHRRALEIALREASRAKIKIDLTLGPSWPLSTPSLDSIDDPRVEQELVFESVNLKKGACYKGEVPVPDGFHGKLLAVTAARKLGDPLIIGGDTQRFSSVSFPLDPSSLIEVLPTRQQVTWCPSVPSDGWMIFGFWQRPSGQRTNREVSGHPAYVIDHFSKLATRALTDDWNNKILNPEIRRLLRATGSDFFGDSLELEASQLWTQDFLEQFSKLRGYSLAKYLPVLHIKNIHQAYAGIMGGSRSPENAPDFEVDGLGPRVREDYYQTLNDLMERNHLRPLADWAHSLGMKLRYQPAYGTTLNLISNTRGIDIPETESLHSGDQIDYHRAMAASAHVLSKQIVSSECCAVMMGDYGLTIADTLRQVRKNFVGGVNQIVLHGRPYLYKNASIPWPGWQPFSPSAPVDFSEAWDSRQPFWKQIGDFTHYLQRTQMVLRQGDAKFDIAVYRESFWWPSKRWFFEDTAPPLYEGGALGGAGYTYDFLDASLVQKLASDLKSSGQDINKNGLGIAGYRALILDNQRVMSETTVEQLQKLTEAGLRLVFVGAIPDRVPGFDVSGLRDKIMARKLDILLRNPFVTRVMNRDDVVQSLRNFGVVPDLELVNLRTVLTASREGLGKFFYLFNNGKSPVIGKAVLNHRLARELVYIYKLNAWNGRIEEITWAGEKPLPGARREIEIDMPAWTDLILLVSTQRLLGAEVYKSSGGTEQAIPLTEWQLKVHEYSPSGGREIRIPSLRLRSWTDISEIQHASGIGEYQTTFVAPVNGTGFNLRLGQVEGSFRLYINGRLVDASDPFADEIKISQFVKPGRNHLRVELCTTLGNRLLTLWQYGWSDQIVNVYKQLGAPLPVPLPYTPKRSGLLGPAEIRYSVRL